MKSKRRRLLLIVASFSWVGVLAAQPPSGTPPFESSSAEQGGGKCSTECRYDSNTMVTFYGDSRMDLVNEVASGRLQQAPRV